jgi:hypothetical protein
VREAQWLCCTDAARMLGFLGRKVSRRKLRLLAVACCRHLFGDVIADPRTRAAIEVSKRYAEGLAPTKELGAARRAVEAAREESWRAKRAAWWVACGRPAAAARGVLSQPVPPPWRHGGVRAPKERPAPLAPAVLAPLAALVRDVVGNPFRPTPRVDPTWLTWNGGFITRLAQEMYDTRSFDRMAVFGDALEDAGCRDEDILRHCREQAVHVRGCWLLDRLLGKE